MWTASYWKAVAERAIKSAAQAGVITVGADLVEIWSLPFLAILGVMATAALLSVLTSLGSSAATGGGPSLNNAEMPKDTAVVVEPVDPNNSGHA